MTVMHGQPRVGKKNARKVTRKEAELTGLPRWCTIYTSPATGEVSFANADILGGKRSVSAIRNKLDKFYMN